MGETAEEDESTLVGKRVEDDMKYYTQVES